MAKKVSGYIKLQIGAGKANPSPPVGPALGQHGVNIMEFCKAFNAQTQELSQKYGGEVLVPVVITVYADRSFSFVTKTPPASFFLKKAAKVKKGASEVGREIVGSVTVDQLKEIAEIKMADLNAHTVDAAVAMLEGSARSMGLEVKG